MATEITYNGIVIASLEPEQTATMSCAGRKAAGDIVAVFEGAGSVVYNGAETAVGAGETATLHCSGKIMRADVMVRYSQTPYYKWVRLLSADRSVLQSSDGFYVTAKENE